MTKHREAKSSSSDTTPILIGGVAALALLAFSQKKKTDSTPVEYDQTFRDPEEEAVADTARQFYRAFATPNGMSLAQLIAGKQAVLAMDYSWYKGPVTTKSKDQAEKIKVGMPLLLSYIEARVAVEGILNEAQFVRIMVNVLRNLNNAARASAGGSNPSSAPPTPSGGPTTATGEWQKDAQK